MGLPKGLASFGLRGRRSSLTYRRGYAALLASWLAPKLAQPIFPLFIRRSVEALEHPVTLAEKEENESKENEDDIHGDSGSSGQNSSESS